MSRECTRPFVTTALVAANVGVYAFERAVIVASGDPCTTYGLVPAHATLGSALTSLFVHDPSTLVHIAGNMLFLAVFGTVVERAIGHARFAALYFAAGVGGALVHVMIDPTATAPLVGASGAIWGVMAAAAMVRPRAVVFVALYFITNLVALFWPNPLLAPPATALGAHIGGFATGFVMLRLVFFRAAVEARGRA